MGSRTLTLGWHIRLAPPPIFNLFLVGPYFGLEGESEDRAGDEAGYLVLGGRQRIRQNSVKLANKVASKAHRRVLIQLMEGERVSGA